MTETVLLRRRITVGAAYAAMTGVFAVILAFVAAHVVARIAELPAGTMALPPLPLPLPPALLAVLGIVALAMLGALAGLLLHCLRLDPDNSVGTSLAWAWRALLAAWPAALAIAIGVAICHRFPGSPMAANDTLVFIALFVFAFGIFTPRTASGTVATRWWLPQWPGWRSLVSVVVIAATWVAWTLATKEVSGLIDEGQRFPWRATLAEIIDSAVRQIFACAAAVLLVLRWRLSDLRRLRGEPLRRLLLAWFVGVVAFAALAFPVDLLQIATALYDIYIRPQADENAMRPMAPLMAHWNWAAAVLDTLAASALALIGLAGWLMQARLIHRLTQPASDASPSDARRP